MWSWLHLIRPLQHHEQSHKDRILKLVYDAAINLTSILNTEDDLDSSSANSTQVGFASDADDYFGFNSAVADTQKNKGFGQSIEMTVLSYIWMIQKSLWQVFRNNHS